VLRQTDPQHFSSVHPVNGILQHAPEHCKVIVAHDEFGAPEPHRFGLFLWHASEQLADDVARRDLEWLRDWAHITITVRSIA
jgi:hypothetical protein